MTKNNKLYNTQYLKSWSQNANKELYLTDQSVLETSYSFNETDYSHDDLSSCNKVEGSWIDLNRYTILSNSNEQSLAEQTAFNGDTNLFDKDGNNNSLEDGSLATILLDLADGQFEQQSRRRSSNTTATSITIVGGGTKVSPKRQEYDKFGGEMIPELFSSSSNVSSSVESDLNFKRNKRRKEKRIIKRNNGLNLSNVLFQITCLSIIIASFSFSLGFLFGARNKASNLKYF